MEMILHSHVNKTHFHKKDCALGLILKVRVFELRSGPFVFSFCREISTEIDVINCQLCSETTHLRLVGFEHFDVISVVDKSRDHRN